MLWKLLRKIAVVLLAVTISAYVIIFWLCRDCKSVPSRQLVTKNTKPWTDSQLVLPRYIGCYASDESPLATFVQQSEHMSVNACLLECYNRDYSFALLKGSDSCYCSSVGGSGVLLTDDRCNLSCSGNNSQRCGGSTSVGAYALRNQNGVQEWTTWMSMEGSNFHKRYRGCILDANGTCTVEIETKTIGELEDWDKDLKNHFVGCFTASSLLSVAITRIVPLNDWPSLGRECMGHCWWTPAPFASIVTLGSDRECICTKTLGNSIPVNTCMDMYGAQVFALLDYNPLNKLKFSVAPLQRKILLVGYLQNDMERFYSFFKDQPAAFHTHNIDLLLRASSEKTAESQQAVIPAEGDNKYDRTMEAVIPIHEVLHPYFRCELNRLSSMFRYWKKSESSDNIGYDSYMSCTQMVDGDIGYIKCLPFLDESCKTSSLLVGATSAFLNLWDVDWLIWHNIDLHVIHIIREPLHILISEEPTALLEGPDNATSTAAQKLCAIVLATNYHFVRHQWTRRLHTLFYEEVALSTEKIVAFASRKLAWNFTNPGSSLSQDNLARTHSTMPRNDRGGTADLARALAVKELGRQQCAAFYKTFPRRYRAPGIETGAASDAPATSTRAAVVAGEPQQLQQQR